MTRYSLTHAFDLLKRFLGNDRRAFSMFTTEECLQIRARALPDIALTLKRGKNAWTLKVIGPRNLLIELEGPYLNQLFSDLSTAIQEAGWCPQFAPVANSGAEAFSH